MSVVFDAYARYYDLLYADKDYAAETDYVIGVVRKHSRASMRILELGCGTGAHAEHLARAGYEVHGVDFSEAMVGRAEARKASLPAEVAHRLSFQQGDVRTVRTGEHYDAVISLFHVMSYQTSNSDLDATFETAYRQLSPGGLFFFDFWYGPAVLTQRPEVRVKRLESDEMKVTRIAEPVMRVNENVVDVNYSMFIEMKASGQFQQIGETHAMRYLFLPELQRFANGRFRVMAANAWMTDRALTGSDWSGCVAMVRSDEAST